MHFGDVAHASLRASEAASLPPFTKNVKFPASNVQRRTFNFQTMAVVRRWEFDVRP